MNQSDYCANGQGNWWERLFGPRDGRSENDMDYKLPDDSLFASAWQGGAESVADVPEGVQAQIREEAVLTAFNRLESSLRLLLHATVPDKEPPSAERCQQILNVWRYELEHRVHLTPDTYCGAVQRYEPQMDGAYIIDGRCEKGDLLRIRVPCWRMFDRVVIRGEAELVGANEVGDDVEIEEAPSMPLAVVAAVPTAATAAEDSNVAVITNPERAQEVNDILSQMGVLVTSSNGADAPSNGRGAYPSED